MTGYPRIIAHRCGGALARENTLAGLQAAAAGGCRGVEFDVMLTADQIPILMHDETLDRTCGIGGQVADLSFGQIRRLDPLVPTLAEAIEMCTSLGLWSNIELKPAAGHDEETGAVVGAWLARYWNGPGVISSFSEKSALAARHYLPAAAFAPLFYALPADWQAVCARLDAQAVHLAADHALAAAAPLRAAGICWACYTVNSRASADHLFAQGCAAIFTDHPGCWQADEM